MSKNKTVKKTARARAAHVRTVSVKEQPSIKHRVFIFGLMGVLVVLIVVVNAMRTEAAPPASDLSLSVIQNGVILEANVDQPEEAIAWRAVRQNNGDCAADSFNFLVKQKTVSRFELTADDNRRYYCFKVKDNNGAYAFKASPLIDVSDLLEPTVAVRQLDGILLAVIVGSDEDDYDWRIVESDGPACNPTTFKDGDETQIPASNLLVLTSDMVGLRYCFEARDSEKAAYYRLSATIGEFEAIPVAGGGVLAIAPIRAYGDTMVARANRPAHWQAVALTDRTECSAAAFSVEVELIPELALTEYVSLESNQAGRYCLQAYDYQERAFRASE